MDNKIMSNLTENEIEKLKKEGKWTVCRTKKAKNSYSTFISQHKNAKRVRRGPQ